METRSEYRKKGKAFNAATEITLEYKYRNTFAIVV